MVLGKLGILGHFDGSMCQECAREGVWSPTPLTPRKSHGAVGPGYGDPSTGAPSCAQPASTVSDYTDCNDNDSTVFPSAKKVQ